MSVPPLSENIDQANALMLVGDVVDVDVVESAAAESCPVELPVKTSEDDLRSAEPPKPAAPRVAEHPEPVVELPCGPSFAKLGLSDAVLSAVTRSGYDTPTDIQNEIIPHLLAGRDVLAQSQTGTGKTAAFALPILSNLDAKAGLPQVLVLAPTRELAMQVARSFETYADGIHRFSVAAIYGGQDYEPQLKQLRRGVHVVVGTPGRVIDHIRRGTLDLSGLKVLVLDEADEMLNMGFLEDVQFVLEQAPAQRQVALFSATLPGPIRNIAETYLRDPVKITIGRQTMTAESIHQRAVFVSPRDKMEALRRFLEAESTDGVIVFTKTKDATITVAEQLIHSGLRAVALNGDMPQKVRERAIEQLKAGRLDVLVATDVAARGLDVPRISHVFNFDLPHDSESYVHRIGRTGRAGREGHAIIFLTHAQRGKLRVIERLTKQPIEIVTIPTADQINAGRIAQFKQRLTEVTAARDLTMFKEMIAQYAEETGKPLDLIAAALAHLSQNGRPFFLRDPEHQQRETSRRDRPDRSPRDAFEGDDRRGGARPDRRARRGESAPRAGMSRYRVDVGWRDGIKPGNLVGAIANEAGIDGEYIGPINIENDHSTIDLPEGMPADIYQTLRSTRVAGKPLRLTLLQDGNVAEDDSQRGDRRPGQVALARPRRPHANVSHSHHSGATDASSDDSGRPKSHGKSGKPHFGKSHGGKPKFVVGKGRFAGAGKAKPATKPKKKASKG